jgi:FtsP/CotA-like multicopper oxidase with cupredoxin domain
VIFLALSAHGADANPSTTPTAQPNDNRVAAGELKRGVLNLQLELVQATWYPDKDGGPNLSVYAFAEKGKLPQIPGPAIRVPQGTEVHVELHNTLPVAMFVRGFRTPEPVAIAPGGTTQVRFMATSPGSFYYSARSCKMSIREVGLLPITEDLTMGEGPFAIESQLEGAIVVDPPGKTPSDRIFVITAWVAGVITPPFREKLAINGKSWPDSERLSARVGQAESWRLINTSVSDHAMHLHGFYFEVKSVGGQDEDHAYAPDDIPRAVTKHLDPGETAFISWTPERPGRWLLHCHMTAHMMPPVSPTDVAESPSHPSHVTAENPSGMGGLVLGITVLPGPGPAVAAASNVTPRQLKLLVREVPATRFSLARMGYLIQDGDAKDTADPPPIPGAPLVLTRGEPTEITVVNQLHEQTSVHWHGIELESYYDGVPNWGGDSLQMTPPIPPGGTFVARMTPPRAGTFIYHTHWHDVAQLTSGLYGPIIVVEPGQKFDPTVDKIFIISREGPDESGLPLLVNGSAQPAPLVLKVGTKYRLRFINIGTNDSDAVVELLSDAKRVPWRAVAKDGWTLPPHQATLRPATQPITVGETYDFEFAPDHAGELSLQVTMPFLKTRVSQAVVIH